MANLIVDPRDQKFVLYEMLGVEELCKSPLYADFSRDMFDMALAEAEKFATTAILPALAEGDREGCRLEAGSVHVPKSFHRCIQIYREGGWGAMNVAAADDGQGFPHVVGRGRQGVVQPQHRLHQLRHPDRRGRPPHRGLRHGGAEEEVPSEDAHGRVGRDDGPDRAGRRHRRGQPEDQGHPAARRNVPSPGDEGVHHRRGQRPHGEHHPSRPRPDRRGPSGNGRDLDLPRPQVPRRR